MMKISSSLLALGLTFLFALSGDVFGEDIGDATAATDPSAFRIGPATPPVFIDPGDSGIIQPTADPSAGSAGADTPTGLAGSFGGSIETGAGSFDPYERNASRSVTDFEVPGAVLPFRYTRTWNSRSGGYWRSNWSWGIGEWASQSEGDNLPPGWSGFSGYTISFPDGRTINLSKPRSDALPGAPGTYVSPLAGVFEYLNVDSDHVHAHLFLTDGSVVNYLLADQGSIPAGVVSVVDPFGRAVTFDYDSVLGTTITEPGHRWIRIGQIQGAGTNNQTTVITTSLGQSVTYNRIINASGYYNYKPIYIPNPPTGYVPPDPNGESIYTDVETITYNDVIDPATNLPVQAHYIYKKAQLPPTSNNPSNNTDRRVVTRLVWASDPMFAGPLQQVKYVYADHPFDSYGDAFLTAVLEVRYATSLADPGVLVSRVEMPPNTYNQYTGGYSKEYSLRTETRGDGPVRTISYFNPDTQHPYYDATTQFHYTSGYGQNRMDHITDFIPGATYQERHLYDWDHCFETPTKITDMRGKVTSQVLEPILGHITQQTHPDTTYRDWSYENPAAPYYVHTTTDENRYQTTYTRDPNTHQITRIDYPDGSFETFSNFDEFGQYQEHQLTTGGTEHFRYEGGLKRQYWPPATESDPNPQGHPTNFYYYGNDLPYRNDRLGCEVDPKGNRTWYDYNGRGQVTRVTHEDQSYTQASYNGDGTLAWTADENHPGAATDPSQRTRYTYDEYKRVTSITDPAGHTTTKSYDLWDSTGTTQIAGSHFWHTSSFVFREVSPGGIIIDQGWDPNQRLSWKRVATGTPDEATTSYEYDAAGNLTRITDPRHNTTVSDYDECNRKSKETDPVPLNGQKTEWVYDGVGNKLRETRSNSTTSVFRSWDYDSINRLWHAYDWRTNVSPLPNQTVTYNRNVPGTVTSMTDQKGAVYGVNFDAMNRKVSATYPMDATAANRNETWHYDIAGNMDLHKNPAGQYEHREYDNRERQWHRYWNTSSNLSGTVPDWNIGPEVMTVLDAGNRLTSVKTNNGATTVAFAYDDANRQLWEDQTVAGYPTHRVRHDPDLDGKPLNTSITTANVNSYLVTYDYTGRSQLKTIHDGAGNPWFSYSYDAAGNMTKRQDSYAGVNDSVNIPSSDYDVLNRPTTWANTWTNAAGVRDQSLAKSHYIYDYRNRETATWREEQGNLGDTFDYNELNQLRGANYNVAGGGPTPTPAPVISGQPKNTAVVAGQPASFSVSAIGAALSYQWRKGSTNLGGATGSTYTVAQTSVADSGAFSVVVSNPGGSAVSDSATLTVSASPTPTPAPRITWQPIDCTRQVGETGFFNVATSGESAPYSYQWQKNGVNVSGGTGSSYNTPVVTMADDGASFSVVVSNAGGSTPSGTAHLHVTAAPPANKVLPVEFGEQINGTWDTVTMSCGTPGATIFFTVNSAHYVNPVHSGGSAGAGTLVATTGGYKVSIRNASYFRAVAYKAGMDDSDPQDCVVNYLERAEEVQPDEDTTPGETQAITHDPNAPRTVAYDLEPLNRKSVTDNGTQTNFVTSPNGLNQYTSVAGQGMSYDGNFNLTQFNFWGGWTYQYNAQNQLISGSGGGNSFLLVYDGLGRCLKRTINGAVTVLAYDGWKPIEEWDGAGNVQAWNIYGPGADEILYRQTTMGAFRYHTDKEGNVTFLLDGNGNGLERYTYDAFGGTTVTDWDGTNVRDWSRYGNRFRFNGREYFAEMGIYDYRNRWYHPYLGRFLQIDPKGFEAGDENLFRYCGDDPVDNTDPTGMQVSEGEAQRFPSQTGGVVDIDNAPGIHGMTRTNPDTGTSMVTGQGRLAVDTDGAGKKHGDDKNNRDIPGGVDAKGRIVPRYLDDGTRNPAAVRPVNADKDSFGVAPKQYAPANGGVDGKIIRIGDRMEGTTDKGTIRSRVADYGPPEKMGEFSSKALRDHGWKIIILPHIGPMPSYDGKHTPNIPVNVRYFPNTAGEQ